MSLDGRRRCTKCGSPLAAANTSDQCFRHQVSTTDEEVIGPPAPQEPPQRKQKVGMCEGCGEEKVIVAHGRCSRCYKRRERGLPDILATMQEATERLRTTKLKPAHVIAAVAAVFGVTRGEVLSDKRNRLLVQARHVAMHLLRQDLGLSLPEVGELMQRDHTSVLHGCRKIQRELSSDPEVQELVDLARKRSMPS